MQKDLIITLDFYTAVELEKAVVARIVDCVVNSKMEICSPQVQALYNVKDNLESYINSGVKSYEDEVVKNEIKILNTEEDIIAFLEKLDRDNT